MRLQLHNEKNSRQFRNFLKRRAKTEFYRWPPRKTAKAFFFNGRIRAVSSWLHLDVMNDLNGISLALNLPVLSLISSLKFHLIYQLTMGVDTGGWDGRPPPWFEILGDVSPKSRVLKTFLKVCEFFRILQYFQNKMGEIQGEIGILGRWF